MLTLRSVDRVERLPERWRVKLVAQRDGRERQVIVELAEGNCVLDVQAYDGVRDWAGGAGDHRLTSAAIDRAREVVVLTRAAAQIAAEDRRRR